MFRTTISKFLSPNVKHIVRNFLGKNRYFDWSDLAEKISVNNDYAADLRVGFVTSSGGHRAGNLFEPGLSLGLNARGVTTSVLLCDGVLSACNITEFGNQKRALDDFLENGPMATGTCNGCKVRGEVTWQTTNSQIFKYSDYLSLGTSGLFNEDFLQDFKFKYKGFEVGEHIVSASLRFLCRGSFDFSSHETIPVIKRYFDAALQTVDVALGYFGEFKPNVVVCFHGIYIPHGVIGEIARSMGIRVINWNTSYRQSRVLFSEGDTYHKTMCYEDERKWNSDLLPWQRDSIKEYLIGRETGAEDWQQFNDNPNMNIFSDSKLNEFNVKFQRKLLLLPNVIWDAQLQYEPTFFANMSSWVLETIKLFEQNPETGLIIRIHPAEVRRYSATREPLLSIIEAEFDQLPENVYIIGPDDDHSTYRLSENVNASVIYGTKTGLELAAVGHPVIVCGEAWIKGKEMSFDPETIDDYSDLLFRKELVMTDVMKENALKFAYHFFDRAALKVEFLKSVQKNMAPAVDESKISMIADNSSDGLRSIIDEIITKKGLFIGGQRN